MLISMQGNWTIRVKSKEASFPQRFIVAGADTGNGTYDAKAGAADVWVTGTQWSIAILNDPGTGFRLSDTRIKFPTLSSGNFVFDIESNDAGSDKDFNDLVLTCFSPASVFDYLIYGNVTLYSNGCVFNPCIRRYLVIDTYAKFLQALKIDKVREVIAKLYPERIPPIHIPNPPDPPPFFTPIMVNLVDEVQTPVQIADVFQCKETQTGKGTKSNAESTAAGDALTNFTLANTVTASNVSTESTLSRIDKIGIGNIVDGIRLACVTEPAPNLTLNFLEYDRSVSELAGGPYTGTGDKLELGNAITDMNGNYIFRFTQTIGEALNEIFNDVASGENVLVQVRPDIIVKVTDSLHPTVTLFESTPYFNVPQIKQINFCLPAEKVRPTSLCFNGNLIGSLGNVFIGGAQNTTGSLSPAPLDRNGYNNHLQANGKITVHNSQAGFGVDCACWGGLIDVKGCMYNLQRKPNDPVIRRYTIRYKKSGGSWQFVNQAYLHPKFSKRFLPLYNGDLVGPFSTPLHVDGGPLQSVPAYINIQAEVFFDGVDWEFSNLDRYMQLASSLYDGGTPGTVYFLVEGYDGSGNLVPNAKDLIALYIHNRPLDFGIGDVHFTATLESVPCGLYRMKDTELNTPLVVPFKSNDPYGFVDHYTLTLGKCPQQITVDITAPPSIVGTITGTLASGSNAGNTDGNNCPGYTGTIADFGTSGFVNVTLQPSASEGGWLKTTEQFAVISIGLEGAMRRTNGYNTGIEGPYLSSAQFYLEHK